MLVRVLLGLLLLLSPCYAVDRGQWENTDPEIKSWYKKLMQPDNPTTPCCGEADAYWADSYEMTKDGDYIAIITDDRDDEPLGRRHLPVGLRITVPKNKIKFNQGNPTGHGIIFINQYITMLLTDGQSHRFGRNEIDDMVVVFCYLPPGGV